MGHTKATDILTEQRKLLERLARELLERESLDGSEVYGLIEEVTGQKLGPEPDEPPTQPDEEQADDKIAAAEATPEEEAKPEGPGPEPLPAPST